MIAIIKATENDFKLLADIGRQTFLESHGESAGKADIDAYVNDKYSYPVVKEELADTNNIYHIIYFYNQPAGYSKIILNRPHPNIEQQNITKLERLYLLKEFYKQRASLELFNFNVTMAKANKQAGMWLFVWKENEKSNSFYLKSGFEINSEKRFSDICTHSNPNHQMFLKF